MIVAVVEITAPLNDHYVAGGRHLLRRAVITIRISITTQVPSINMKLSKVDTPYDSSVTMDGQIH